MPPKKKNKAAPDTELLARKVELAAIRVVSLETTMVLAALKTNKDKPKIKLGSLDAVNRGWLEFWGAVHAWRRAIK